MNAEELLYAESHEWVHVADSGDGKVATVGISAHAVEALTDLVYMDLPEPGTGVTAGSSFGEVESVKATSEMYSPVTGEITEVNTSLPDNLDVLNTDPYGEGWIIKIRVTSDEGMDNLLDHSAYQKLCEESQ